MNLSDSLIITGKGLTSKFNWNYLLSRIIEQGKSKKHEDSRSVDGLYSVQLPQVQRSLNVT